MSRLFCCYSADLKDFLYKRGFRYDVCGLNPNNHQMFWAYIRTPELSDALDKWSAAKR
jgi:hypothetical protein